MPIENEDDITALTRQLGMLRKDMGRLSVLTDGHSINIDTLRLDQRTLRVEQYSLSKVADSIGARVEDLEDILENAHKKATKAVRRWTVVLTVTGSFMCVSAVLSILETVGVFK